MTISSPRRLAAALGAVAILSTGWYHAGAADSPTTATAAEPTRGGTLRVVHPSGINNLDPHIGVSGLEHVVLYTMYDRLIDFEPTTMLPVPALAESWQFSDPMTFELTLVEGTLFHDGTVLDAEAVKYNIERGMNHPDSSIKADLMSVDSVEVVDPLTVRINLKEPNSALPLILSDRAGMMVSPTAAEELGEEFTRNPVGTGPFVFDSLVPGESVKVRRFEDYRIEGLPYLDGIDFTVISESRTATNALISHQQDFLLAGEVADMGQYERADGITVVTAPTLGLSRCALAVDREPFNNPLLRRAMNYAINREAINQVVYAGLGEPATSLLPASHWAHPTSVPVYSYDPERARELLTEAGYPDGITIETLVVTRERDRKMVEAMQAQAEAAGIHLEVQALAHAEAMPAFRERGEGDMYCVGWSGRPDPYQTYAALLLAGSAYMPAYDMPAGLEEAIAKTVAVDDEASRAAAFDEASIIAFSENDLHLNVVFGPAIHAFSTRVNGFEPNLYGKPMLSQIWLSED